MIQRDGKDYILSCDICIDYIYEGKTFNECVQAKKDDGWKSKKLSDGIWQDICPECRKEECQNDL